MISPYIRALRDRVGAMRLLIPSVSAHIFDDEGRLLLVRQRDSGVWSTPGGSIEPDERPANAVVREVWEETGLLVNPMRVLTVYGGPEFVVRYPHGDEAQYVIVACECVVTGGALRDENDEVTAVRYWSREDAERLDLSPWLRAVLPGAYRRETLLEAPTWRPEQQ